MVGSLEFRWNHGHWIVLTNASISTDEALSKSGLLLHLEIVGSLLIYDVPAREILFADVHRGGWLMSIDNFMEEVDVARSVVLDSLDKAFVSRGTNTN